MLPFAINEYQERINQVKDIMQKRGIEVLLITNPANMNYLSGYDAWSFYVHQMLVIILDEDQPLWLGRYQDANGAKATTWLYDDNIIPYPDYYVQSKTYHPMGFIASILSQIGQGNRHIGVEMENYYFSAKAYEMLKTNLPNATFKDASQLVNNVRLIKSDQEIEYIKRAAEIGGHAMQKGIQGIHAGVRENDVAATIYHALISGTDTYGGDYPAIVPLLPAGKKTSAPHLTWSEDPYQAGEAVIVELAGCYKRYHAPLARTVSIGKPSQAFSDLSLVLTEGLNKALEAVKPGVTCEEIERVWRESIAKHGIKKESRLGYSMGLSYPPDWGEHTASLRPGDQTVLQPNMTFHMIPGLWFDNQGIEISESFRVTEQGCEVFSNYPRELLIQEPLPIDQSGKIS
ncbi:M24 family metallopeptidase [Tuberibacillus sp. Marseille-P3662]|uniref:M24 family metallopeptidase n=1 Tax=Tuberibacillus sp. Marseille-P3662 TaxID=1965358 RepID=UPI000A1CA047|nr:M24 family metallopeptidase [Tuberibacillus sp. Marseille-P3662]